MAEDHYRIVCQHDGCTNQAAFKVAAEWSDSTFRELKTYALACETHLEPLYRDARRRCGNYPLSEGESLMAPGVYELKVEGAPGQLERPHDPAGRFWTATARRRPPPREVDRREQPRLGRRISREHLPSARRRLPYPEATPGVARSGRSRFEASKAPPQRTA